MTTKGRGRLKGKVRRDAKEQKTYIPTPHTIQKYVIAVKNSIPLAKFILASKPLISVPPSFVETLDRVIYVRARFGAQLIDHGMKPSTKSDATHYFFVGILEKARDILRPRMPAGTKSFYCFEDLGNRFSGLKIYESSPELLDFTDIKRPKNAQGDDTIYEAEPEISLKDALVAFTIMMNDLNQIRCYLEWIWSDYRDGYFNLANAVISTNTGINLARNLIDQSDRSSRKDRAKFKKDQIILSEFFTEAVMLARIVPNYPVEDEFIQGIRELDTTGNIPFRLVYATQILLDFHHIIRDRTSSAVDSLLKHTTTMDSELSSHIDFHGNLKIENWPASNEGALCEFNQSLQWFAQDLVCLAKQRVSQGAGSLAMESERNGILVHSPILCGLMLYHFRAKMCNFGIAITNAWGSITYSAHLYDALRNEGLLNEHWTNMDAI
ncbi:uncharacterized protein FRV6_08519 [Fusarium oxysporum]|uniref:DUF6604 domain-containing protein n=1 Tax=Fusarium oxysporum TaxID=5507 RepID=A0A2H3T6Q3_FUSOX|nr:uncharacterized protein FRV6_08519 [Fusarium oxysporum]